MDFSICYSGFALMTVFMAIHICEARDLPNAGLLDEMPKNCSGMDFCIEQHKNYPQEKIDQLLTKKYRLLLAHPHEDPEFRYGADDEGHNDCEKDMTFAQIYEINDEHNNIRVVVQSKRFKQQLKIERCVAPGRLFYPKGTEHLSPSQLTENEFICEEKKMHYNFFVLTRDGEAIESVRSKTGIPVCCACRVVSD